MTNDNTVSWQSEFGLDKRHSSDFFGMYRRWNRVAEHVLFFVKAYRFQH